MTNLVNFHPTTQKWKFDFHRFFLSKVYEVWAKKYRVVVFHGTEQCKIWKNPDLVVLKLAWVNQWTFIRENTQKSTNLYFDGLFLSDVYNVSARKFQRNYVLWHWKMMQNLKENWLVAWKMTIEIWLILMRAVKCLKIFTLMGWFCPKHMKF